MRTTMVPARRIAKCGYLFVAPDRDYSLSVNRTKRWQRRWFILYEDGELRYSLDEDPETIPQGVIDMNSVMDVSEADDRTGNQFSIAVTAPEKVYFIKGTSKEEKKWWFDVLSRYPKLEITSPTKPNCNCPYKPIKGMNGNNGIPQDCNGRTNYKKALGNGPAWNESSFTTSRSPFFDPSTMNHSVRNNHNNNSNSSSNNNNINNNNGNSNNDNNGENTLNGKEVVVVEDVVDCSVVDEMLTPPDDVFYSASPSPEYGLSPVDRAKTFSNSSSMPSSISGYHHSSMNFTTSKQSIGLQPISPRNKPRFTQSFLKEVFPPKSSFSQTPSTPSPSSSSSLDTLNSINHHLDYAKVSLKETINVPPCPTKGILKDNNFVPKNHTVDAGVEIKTLKDEKLDLDLMEKLKHEDSVDSAKLKSLRYMKRKVRGMKSQRSRSDEVAKMLSSPDSRLQSDPTDPDHLQEKDPTLKVKKSESLDSFKRRMKEKQVEDEKGGKRNGENRILNEEMKVSNGKSSDFNERRVRIVDLKVKEDLLRKNPVSKSLAATAGRCLTRSSENNLDGVKIIHHRQEEKQKNSQPLPLALKRQLSLPSPTTTPTAPPRQKLPFQQSDRPPTPIIVDIITDDRSPKTNGLHSGTSPSLGNVTGASMKSQDTKEWDEVLDKLQKAIDKCNILNKELKESHANYDNLELAYNRLRKELSGMEKLHEAELGLMEARINDLTAKLNLSERSLFLEKQKIVRYEARQDRRRTNSLKGKESLHPFK